MFIALLSQRELLLPDIVISTTLKGKAILKESSDLLSMTQEEALPFSKSISETPIDISIELSTSSLLREPTLVSTSSAEEKLLSQSAMFSLLTELQRVLSFATLNLQLETRDLILDAPEHMPPLSGILKMEAELESDFPLVPEKLSLDIAELPLELLQVEEETKNPS